MGNRHKPSIAECKHVGPLEVSSTAGGKKRARCLVCGMTGPERAESLEAIQALRDEARDEARRAEKDI